MKLEEMKITVVGLGMEGGSLAIAIRNNINPIKLWAVDINSDVLTAAEKLHVIDQGFVEPEYPFQNSDMVIMCIYPGLIIDYIKKYNDVFKHNCIITDIAGVKEKLTEEVSKFLRHDLDFIPGHPMAGNEYTGFLYANKDIFDGANYIITPSSRNKDENIQLIKELAQAIGCTKISIVDSVTHDKMIAYVSQLIHVIAVSVVINENFNENIFKFSGGSFRGVTRVGNINPNLWTDAFFENKEHLLKQLEVFEDNMKNFKDSLINDDRQGMYELLEKSSLIKTKYNI